MLTQFPEARILEVDLTQRKIEVKHLSSEIHRKYPGGSILGMYLLLNQQQPGVEPLSPENMLVFSVSPLAGFPFSGQSRMNVATKSPLTHAIADSQVGGYIAPHVKSNGFDAVVIKGKADAPVYLYVNGEESEIRDARMIWGKVTGEAEKAIRKDVGEDKLQISTIGPAGENLVKFANIMHMGSRASGRNGIGAVMGAKNLKALVVREKPMAKPYNPEGFKAMISSVKEDVAANSVCVNQMKNGTANCLESMARDGFLPTRNWQTGWFENYEEITGERMSNTIKVGNETCFGCAARCKQVVEVEGKVDPEYGGPEYETCATFGSFCGNDNLEQIALANMLCNKYGMDTISCGSTIAFAMECYEKGILPADMAEGLDLRFGNSDIYEEILYRIAYRKGKLGNLLAEGSYRAAKTLGNGAEELSITCKGQELPAHMPHLKPSLALIYSINPIGADHQSSEHDPSMGYAADSKERGWMAQVGANIQYAQDFHVLDYTNIVFGSNTQKFYSLLDSLCLCQFMFGPAWQLYGPEHLVRFCNTTLGWDTSVFELMEIGERRINMMRIFNAREGFTREQDQLPKRLFQPLQDGPSAGMRIDEVEYEKGKEFYYEIMGWDKETGNPKESTLRKLSLEWLIV